MSMSHEELKAAAVKRPDPDYDVLMRMPEEILRAHDRQFALMHDRQVVAFMPSFKDAVVTGRQRYRPGEFTVQQVVVPLPPTGESVTEPPRRKRPDPDFEALTRMPEDYLRQHERQFALMHQRKVVDFFQSFGTALDAGRTRFSKGDFTVQQVRLEPVHVGTLAMFMPPSR